jgi:Holliday junction resolvasome RuvABC endonuclease subunit
VTLLALDISSTAVGYVVVDADGIDFGSRTLKGKTLQVRIHAAYHALRLLLDEAQPTAVAYEQFAWHSRVSIVVPEVSIIAILLLLCEQRGITPSTVNVSEAKSALVGSGKGDKEAMLRAAATAFGYDPAQLAYHWRKKTTRNGRTVYRDWYAADADGVVAFEEHAADALGVARAAQQAIGALREAA